ncbi:outer membrane beta-barrel protein [Sphingomonas sabuli]|uniref:Outer membrane beta-barrel protein n=1 Tax=Sphingomonas sabuli TaxID=2764186 RepID=A0A7G9L1X3_9SPHN|nr:outer membrane beta-barrel protein [Sphingomonas sabuli]QNM82622.1 outer membrane beta-barrel protein [Sphingomonas sabuli]
MKNYFLAAVAAAAIASPALAQTVGPYVGIEGGVMFPKDTNVNANVNYMSPAIPDATYKNVATVNSKTGFDVDAIGGYDFGIFRLEGELGYKRAKTDSLQLNPSFVTAYRDATGVTLANSNFDLNDKVTVLSGMVNGLVDFELGGASVYGGVGAGRARVKLLGDSDNAWAYQGIAGVRIPVTSSVGVGLKYRYFRTAKLNFNENATVADAGVGFASSNHFSSHSVLASLIYNFGAPAAAMAPMPVAAPAPPPPPPPATQTCPDGTVIMATDICPAPPPPPPPPAPAPERG